MRIIIPVAGVGTRMRPHTFTMPKALIPVAGKPMVTHIIELVQDLDPSEIAVVIGFLGDQIQDYFESHFSLPFKFYRQAEMKGLGHAVWQVLKEGSAGETLIVLGDSIVDVDYSSVVKYEESVIGVKEVKDPRRFGIVELDGDFVSRLVEKPDEPTSNLAIAGLYYFPSGESLHDAMATLIERDIRTKGEYQLTDALQILIDNGELMRPYPIEGWYDCGKPETLLETQRSLLAKTGGSHEVLEGSLIYPPVVISEEATVEGSIIGPDVTLEKGVVIRNSIVSDSIVCRGAEITGSNITQSIVGVDAKVKGRGTKINIGRNAEFNG
jgi:glucose-1-phosphate thymidylyltransferase